MKAVFGLLGLLLVLALVGVLAKKQLGALKEPVPALALPAPPGSGAQPAAAAVLTPQQQQAVPQQYKQAVEAVLQQPRPMPDDK